MLNVEVKHAAHIIDVGYDFVNDAINVLCNYHSTPRNQGSAAVTFGENAALMDIINWLGEHAQRLNNVVPEYLNRLTVRGDSSYVLNSHFQGDLERLMYLLGWVINHKNIIHLNMRFVDFERIVIWEEARKCLPNPE